MLLHVFSHFNLLCKDARGRGRDHGAKRRNPFRAADEWSLSNVPHKKNRQLLLAILFHFFSLHTTNLHHLPHYIYYHRT